MPYALFFDNTSGEAFHVGPVTSPSHGCIHLNEEDAK